MKKNTENNLVVSEIEVTFAHRSNVRVDVMVRRNRVLVRPAMNTRSRAPTGS